MHHKVKAFVGAVAAALVLGGCALGPAGRVADAAHERRGPGPGALPTSPPTPSASPSALPSASAVPSASPSDTEALNIFRTLELAPLKADGKLDEEEAARRLAEPMLSLVKASWRIAKPKFRLDGRLAFGIIDEKVWRAAPTPGGDRWFAVSGTYKYEDADGERGTGRIFVFRATAADPTWKFAFGGHTLAETALPPLSEGADGYVPAVTSDDGLVMPVGRACQAHLDVRDRASAAQWGPTVNKGVAEFEDYADSYESAGLNAVYTGKLRTDAVGPVWRTSDGGALVPCLVENRWTIAVKPGYGPMTQTGESRYLLDVEGSKIRGYVDTNISMKLLVIPTTGKPDFVAGLTYPLDYTQTAAR
ncbi:hypothetical protein [Yinghuangia sp. YIM S09857]|uniref:hypothetical protein n=1 Tax=Yinghuangia sp. YIM S09857 TaxID=3436929 RepID=UPI003F5309DA